MKLHQIALLAVGAVGLVLFTGCAIVGGAPYGGDSPAMGLIYKDTTAPATDLSVAVAPDVKPSKVGTAKATSILGLVGTGDASLEAAMRDGKITKVHHVDHKVMNILGLYGEWTLMVYGE